MTRFWRTWMQVWCWSVVGFGALLAAAAIPGLDGPTRFLLQILGGGAEAAAPFDDRLRFAVGLIGAVTAGWGLTTLVLVHVADAAGAVAWRGQTAVLLVWYVIDGAISVGTGFAGNVVSNTLLMAGYLVPVLASGVLRSGAPRSATA